MFSKKIWIVFIVLIIVYAFVMQEGEGLGYLNNASRWFKHVIHFSFLIFFSLIGYLGWVGYPEKWIVKIWIAVYSFIFIILGIGGVIDMISKIENLGIRYSFGYIRQFGTSPIPYAMCMLLVKLKETLSRQAK